MDYSVLDRKDVSYLNNILFDVHGNLKVLSWDLYKTIPQEDITLFGYFHGLFCFPTIELANWLLERIDVSKTIEIGAGHGALARYLKIPATDSKCMELPDVKRYYDRIRQPTTKYPSDIIKLDALEAIQKYKPSTVIGCWITHKYNIYEHKRGGNVYGVNEVEILKKIDQYIIVGNEKVHYKKKILDYPHEEFRFPWLVSRSLQPHLNTIYVWNNKTL